MTPALAESVLSRLRSVAPERKHVKADALAGLPAAISSVPDGIASGILAGVNPVHGLYASFIGPDRRRQHGRQHAADGGSRPRAAAALGGRLWPRAGVGPNERQPRRSCMLTDRWPGRIHGRGRHRFGWAATRASCRILGDGRLPERRRRQHHPAGSCPISPGAPAEGRVVDWTKALERRHPPGRDRPGVRVAHGLAALAILVALARTRLESAFVGGSDRPRRADAWPASVAGHDRARSRSRTGEIPSGVPAAAPARTSPTLFVTSVAGGQPLAVAAIVLVQGARRRRGRRPTPTAAPTDANQRLRRPGHRRTSPPGLFRRTCPSAARSVRPR